MEESRELNAVIDVIMIAGTILLKSGLWIAMFLPCQPLSFSPLKIPIFRE